MPKQSVKTPKRKLFNPIHSPIFSVASSRFQALQGTDHQLGLVAEVSDCLCPASLIGWSAPRQSVERERSEDRRPVSQFLMLIYIIIAECCQTWARHCVWPVVFTWNRNEATFMPTCAIAGTIDNLQAIITKQAREALSVNSGHRLPEWVMQQLFISPSYLYRYKINRIQNRSPTDWTS
jgi:hypothetical protein